MSRPETRTQRRGIRPIEFNDYVRKLERRSRVKNLALITTIAIPVATFFFATSDEYDSHPVYGTAAAIIAVIGTLGVYMNVRKLRRARRENHEAVALQKRKRWVRRDVSKIEPALPRLRLVHSQEQAEAS